MKPETSKDEILEAIGLLASNVQGISDHLEDFKKNTQTEFNTIHEALHEFAGHVDEQFGEMNSRLTRVEATMVTKSYLDDKLFDLKGDMIAIVRREDQKVNRLVSVLAEKKVLAAVEAKDVLSLKVFP